MRSDFDEGRNTEFDQIKGITAKPVINLEKVKDLAKLTQFKSFVFYLTSNLRLDIKSTLGFDQNKVNQFLNEQSKINELSSRQ